MAMTDQILGRKINEFQKKLIDWAQQNELWYDSTFWSYLEYYNDEPSDVRACISVLTSDGPFFDMLNCYEDGIDEFEGFMETQEFFYERADQIAVHFYPKDDTLNINYIDYFEWQWITELIKPDYTNLYGEIFEYFKNNSDKFYNLHHRKFEILIYEIFKNQGYQCVLGSGTNDGGVDVRLFENGIDQIPTLIQVKKYKPTLPIKLEAVAALSGIVHTDGANRGLFVSTSGYAPVAKKFAARKNSKITLADATDVSIWSEKTSSFLMRDRSRLFSDEYLLAILRQPPEGLVGKILVRNTDYMFIASDFYIIVKDTSYVSLIMELPHTKINFFDPPYNTRGTVIPITDNTVLKNRVKGKVFRATKNISHDGKMSFYANKDLMNFWDGKPAFFGISYE